MKKAFAGSVEDYLAFCKERGEDPEKPFSGQFVVRAAPSLHKAMFSAAKRAGMSLNKWVTSTWSGRSWRIAELRVSVTTVRTFETEKSAPQRSTLDMMRRVLEAAGSAFTKGSQPGVRLKG